MREIALRLADRWIWDFWFAWHEGTCHLFYLQAPRSLGDPELRHHNASVGHAVSTDLTSWTVLPDALMPGEQGSWDDLAIWTGSLIRHDGRWHMLYTGIGREEASRVQRIGLATSLDLVNWAKHEANPVIEHDPRWYELLDLTVWGDQAWRDPWLIRDPSEGYFHALLTARSAAGDPDARGVIGHARSSDLSSWEVLPPVTSPGEFGHLEVPQVVELGGRFLLLFSAQDVVHSAERIVRLGAAAPSGTFCASGSSRLGPFDIRSARPLSPERTPSLFSGKLIENGAGNWYFLAFVLEDAAGEFVGELGDPIPVTMRDGKPVLG
ncbi:MAG TPA: hypothetical protein VII83_06550 [Gaiellaceae bacterium]